VLCAGVVVVALAIVHAAALLFWLYLLAKSGNLPTSTLQEKKFKKFSVTYDFDEPPVKSSPLAGGSAQYQPIGPSKRNRSIPSFSAIDNH
jgi:hypothetical protein